MPGPKYTQIERKELQDFLNQVDKRKNAEVVARALVTVYQAFGRTRFDDVEEVFRTINANTYLIAVPYSFDPTAVPMLPDGNEEYPFYLWIGVNGKVEAEEKFSELKTTYDENKTRLDQTGLLIQRGRPGNN